MFESLRPIPRRISHLGAGVRLGVPFAFTFLALTPGSSAQQNSAAVPKPAGVQKGIVDFRPSDAENHVPEIFRQGPSRFQWELKPLRTATRHHVWALRFPSPLPGDVPANNIVHAEYFLPASPPPDGGKYPAAVVLHILGADFPLSRFMAARLADQGVAALFVQLPYYGKRKPQDQPEARFLSGDMNRSVTAFRQGVLDIRRAIAWLASRPEVDATKIHATGISLGGIMAALATSIDPMASGGVFVLAGGGLAEQRIACDGGRHRSGQSPCGERHDPDPAAALLHLFTHDADPTSLLIPLFPRASNLHPSGLTRPFRTMQGGTGLNAK